MEEIHTSLRDTFGFAGFRPGQAEALHCILAGQHTLVVMPTGSGKSLIYQLAALHLPGVTLVISPLIALMKDQVDSLQARGVAATFVNSSLDSQTQRQRLAALAEGALKIAYVAPERLRSTAFTATCQSIRVSLLAVDEAHCLSQWGHDFRPDYLHIAKTRRALGDPTTVALTATATPQVQDDIVRLLDLPAAERIVTGFNRPNLLFEVNYTRDLEAKLAALRELLESIEGAGIVYVGTRRDAEEVAEFAREVCDVDALHYHAGLDAGLRAQTQEAFLAGDTPLIVATNAFGMGVDRPDVRYVAHYTLPGSLEAYYQEAGRAGRDGLPARCVLFYAPQDRALQEWFIENDAPSLEEVRALYAAIRSQEPGDAAAVTLNDLSLATGLHEVKVKVGLAQLEKAGALCRLGDAGPRIYIALGELDEAALQAASGQVEAQRAHKRRQLAKMITYAETNACRRRTILAHFGDKSDVELELCCDNCLAHAQASQQAAGQPHELEEAERAALVILDTVRRLGWQAVGRHKLAQILKGSRAQDMTRYGYDKSIYYGRYAALRLKELGNWIDQLIEAGYLKVVGGEQPVVQLTPRGEQAIKARSAIPLQLPREIRPAAARKAFRRDTSSTVTLTSQLAAQGLPPAQIAAQRGLAESTIYLHLAQLIAQGELDVSAVVSEQVQALVRAAIQACGGAEQLAPLKARLPENITYGEIRCVAEAWKRAASSAAAPPAGDETAEDSIAGFLARPHPRQLHGPWAVGWALDFHSRFSGAEWSRSAVGELTYRYKYEGRRELVEMLADRLAELVADQPELAQIDAIVAVPPSTPHAFDPVSALCEALGQRLKRPAWPVLSKTRATAPQKEMHTLAHKRANVAGAFAVTAEAARVLRGKRLLVIDDLYDSGATLEEVTRTLQRAGATAVMVLTLTRTIHADA